MSLADLWNKLWTAISNEPLVILGVVIAAVNATSDQSIKGYVLAALVAVSRFLVTGPAGTAAAKAAPPP